MGRPRKSKAEVSASRRAAAITRHHGAEAADADRMRAPLGANEHPSALLPGVNDYDRAVRAGAITYSEARVREQVREQEILNAIKSMELDKQRGKLHTKEEVQEQRDKEDAAIFEEVSRLPEAMAALFPPEQKAAVAKSVKTIISEFRTRVEARFMAMR